MLNKHKINTLIVEYTHNYLGHYSPAQFSGQIKKITIPVNCGTLTIEEGQEVAVDFHVGLAAGYMELELSVISTTILVASPTWEYTLGRIDTKIIDETRLGLPVNIGALFINPLTAKGHSVLTIQSNVGFWNVKAGYQTKYTF